MAWSCGKYFSFSCSSKRPNTEAGLLSTLASAVSLAGGASVGQYDLYTF